MTDLCRGSSAVADRGIPINQVFVNISDIGKARHALPDLVDAPSDGPTLCLQQPVEPAIVASLREEDAGIRTVQIVVVEVLHHQQGLPGVLVRRQHELVVHG